MDSTAVTVSGRAQKQWVAYTWKICNLQGSHTFDEGNLKVSEIVKTGQLEGCHHLSIAMHLEVRIGTSLKASEKNSMSPCNWDDSLDLDCPQLTSEDKLGEAPLSANPDPTAASAYQPSLDYEDSHDPLNCREDIDDHKGARIPKWMLPEIDDDLRNRLRPDTLRISGLLCTIARPPQSRHVRPSLLIEILEIGFCSDTRWKEKLHKKKQQHV